MKNNPYTSPIVTEQTMNNHNKEMISASQHEEIRDRSRPLNINQVAMVRHNSSFMLKDYSNNNDARDHVMQDDSFVGGRGDN